LHSTQQRRDGLAGCSFGGGLVDPQLRGELVHGNVSKDVVYSTHHCAFLPGCAEQRQIEYE
jgi:hypothetical protein